MEARVPNGKETRTIIATTPIARGPVPIERTWTRRPLRLPGAGRGGPAISSEPDATVSGPQLPNPGRSIPHAPVLLAIRDTWPVLFARKPRAGPGRTDGGLRYVCRGPVLALDRSTPQVRTCRTRSRGGGRCARTSPSALPGPSAPTRSPGEPGSRSAVHPTISEWIEAFLPGNWIGPIRGSDRAPPASRERPLARARRRASASVLPRTGPQSEKTTYRLLTADVSGPERT